MKRTLLAALLTLSLSAAAQDLPSYERQADQIGEMVKSGKLSPLDGNREMLAAAKAYFPNDPLLHDTWMQIVAQSERYTRGEIDKTTYNSLVAMAWDRFDRANKIRQSQPQQPNPVAAAILLRGIGIQNATTPVGTRCVTSSYGSYKDTYCN